MDYIRSFFVSSGLIPGFNSPAGIIVVSVVPVCNPVKYMKLRLFSGDDADSKDDNENRYHTSKDPVPLNRVHPGKRGICFRHFFKDNFKKYR
jgi:hypothetical protein